MRGVGDIINGFICDSGIHRGDPIMDNGFQVKDLRRFKLIISYLQGTQKKIDIGILQDSAWLAKPRWILLYHEGIKGHGLF